MLLANTVQLYPNTATNIRKLASQLKSVYIKPPGCPQKCRNATRIRLALTPHRAVKKPKKPLFAVMQGALDFKKFFGTPVFSGCSPLVFLNFLKKSDFNEIFAFQIQKFILYLHYKFSALGKLIWLVGFAPRKRGFFLLFPSINSTNILIPFLN